MNVSSDALYPFVMFTITVCVQLHCPPACSNSPNMHSSFLSLIYTFSFSMLFLIAFCHSVTVLSSYTVLQLLPNAVFSFATSVSHSFFTASVAFVITSSLLALYCFIKFNLQLF